LTFLNQCLRPGDTIPVIKKDAQGNTVLNYNDAVNTAFGSPPVLVLRVGDFYNTKIIPDSLQINYENLDINPEGIGVQPMIANVTLSFKFVGGSGIKEAVDKIQNALSFNYYANTEIYDDRADTTDTESLSQIDLDFKQLFGNVPPPTVNQVQNNDGQTNSSFIGTKLGEVNSATGTTGTINYKSFMTKVSDETQNYFQNIVNKNKEVLAQYNEGIRQIWSLDRLYTKGYLVNDDEYINIFGKPSSFQKNINKIFKDLISDVDSDTDQFMTFLKQPSLDFSDKLIRAVRTNYKNYLKDKESGFMNPITKVIQEVTIQQQNYIQTLARLNVATYGNTDPGSETGTDGYAQKNNFIREFYTNTSSVIQGLIEDGNKIKTSLNGFNDTITATNNFTSSDGKIYSAVFTYDYLSQLASDVFRPIGTNAKWENKNIQRQYVILSQEVVDDKKYESFKNALIGSVLNNPKLFGDKNLELEKQFDAYWKVEMKPIFVKENSLANEFITSMEKEKTKLINYLNFTPYDKNKDRITDYSNVPGFEDGKIQDRKKLITSLGNTTNPTSSNKQWNIKQDGLLISMVKFN
jgi:hypothetical protein